MKKEEIFEYVKKQYGTMPEYLWAQSPDNAVLRHKNGKWYAVVMSVEKCKLGLEGNEFVDIMDVKYDYSDLWIFARIPYEQTALDHNFTGWFSK